MKDELEEFQTAIKVESHVLADLEGTDLPEEFEKHLSETTRVFTRDKSELDKAIKYASEGHITRAFIEFRKFLDNFPYKNTKKIYVYCSENKILSERQLRQFRKALNVYEKEGQDLEQNLLEYALEIGKERIQENKHQVYIEKKAIEKSYSLTSTYQKDRGNECAGVFKYEPSTHKTYLKDFRGLNEGEGSYEEDQVNYSDNFREELRDVGNNKYLLMHSHPLMGNEMGSIAYRPSEQDLEFFRNHNSQIAVICPLLPKFLGGGVSMSAISLESRGFSFLPINIVKNNNDVTGEYPSVRLYNNLLYLISTADLGNQTSDESMGTIQFMLGQEVLEKLFEI